MNNTGLKLLPLEENLETKRVLKQLINSHRVLEYTNKKINEAVEQSSVEIQTHLPKIYSKELVELLFFEFYTKINYIEKGLGVTRKTAAGYLSALEEKRILSSQKVGKEKIYLNNRLFDIVKG